MIWAFENHDSRIDSERQFFDHSDVVDGDDITDQIDKIKYDRAGHEAWNSRKQNGFRLFGKYFTSLWS